MLTNDISNEFALFADFGPQLEPATGLRLESGVRIERRFGDWQFKETVSGREGSLARDYATMGLWLGISHRYR